jgi:LacI family transcriptional regulator
MPGPIRLSNRKFLYSQVYDVLYEKIVNGTYKEKLPTEKQLITAFKVSGITVRQALNKLVLNNVIYRRPKKGTFIDPDFFKTKNNEIANKDVYLAVSSSIMGGFYDVYYYKIFESIEKGLRKSGYNMIMIRLEDGQTISQKLLERILLGNCKVLLIAGYVEPDFLNYLSSHKIRPVCIESNIDRDDIITVMVDNVGGAYDAVEFLIHSGHKRIAFLGGKDELCSVGRLEGYRNALESHGLKFDPGLVRMKGLYIENGREGMAELLDLKADFTAVFCVTDHAALGALSILKERKVMVPEDLSLIGFDDLEFSGHISPGLTTMRTDRGKLGELAVKKALEVIKQKTAVLPDKVFLKPEIVIRESTRKIDEFHKKA